MFFWSFMHRIQSPATSSDTNGWLAGAKQCWNAFISVLVIRKPLSNVHWEFPNPRSQSGSVASPSFPGLISSSLYLSLTLPLCFAANASSPTPLPECLASSQSISTARGSPMSIWPLIRASCSRALPYAELQRGPPRFGFGVGGGWRGIFQPSVFSES